LNLIDTNYLSQSKGIHISMKLAVVGSRQFNDYALLVATLDQIKPIELIISGGAKGADTLAEQYAKDRGIATQIYLPEWEKYGKSAGIRRNHDIMKNADQVVAFWDGCSPGTSHSIKIAEKMGAPVKLVFF
jgi:hypothetical protein